ncbi:MAG: S41 family peptidase [Proteobacteria bacterium]|jgi:carboxyl-terminal processing protease|nr:S41 family peptidase [Pseudomonadota bacterium]MCG6935374.1 S41 family peptidase [Pseudomonadota bacterium]
MNSFTRNTLILLLGMLAGLSLAIGQGVMAEKAANSPNAGLPLESVRTLSEVFDKIKQNYVEEVDDKTLLNDAVSGMVSSLDPHSSYLDEKSFEELRVGTTGEFGGLGIVVGMEDGFVKVVSPIDDTPAQRAGVQSGDLIIRLDDKPVKGMGLDEAVKIMRGKPGTDITLTVVRKGEDKPLKFTITRDRIRVKSVKSKLLEPGYAYVRISQFQERTGKDLRKAISKMKKESKGKLKGLVLDLRNNPGGLLDSAVSVSDAFLNKGVIVSIKGRTEDSKISQSATPGDIMNGAPIVVLVNEGSASASEIVAGALQDHKRAIIMGELTFGKGSVQTVIPIGTNTALKLTTARYYTPSGNSIQAEGIKPDIDLDNIKVAKKENNDIKALSEADLTGHLENPNGKDKKNGKQKDGKDGKEETKDALAMATDDFPVYEALNLLKGLNLLSQQGK